MKMVVFKRSRFTQGKNDDDLGDVEEDCIFHIEHGCCYFFLMIEVSSKDMDDRN